jgi:hypothetical protein
MAARRLLIVMLVLLGISTLLAALTPTRDSGSDTTTSTQSAPPTVPAAGEPQDGGGARVPARIDADSGEVTQLGSAEAPIYAGDELVLTVASEHPDQVEIPGFGEIQAVSRDAPASFDLFLDKPGDYAVRLVDANRMVGRLTVSEAPREPGPGSGSGSPG